MTSYILRMKRFSKRVRVTLAIVFLISVAAFSIISEQTNPASNLYSLMGIRRDASPNDIKRAFRLRSVELHPDKNPSENAEEEFNRLRAAFDILSNAEKRRLYDCFGEDAIAKDQMTLMIETGLKSFSFYAIWAVMVYFFTLKEENKQARSWVYCGEVMLLIFETNLLFGRRDFDLPFSLFSFVTIHEFVTAIHSAFPFFMNGCRAISTFYYRDIMQENLTLGFELLKSNKQIALGIRELKAEVTSMQRRPIRDAGGSTATIESESDTNLTKRSKLTKSIAKPIEKDLFAKEKELATPTPQVPAPRKIKIPLYAVAIAVLVIAKYLLM
ncbi:unnamed protein product [Albugo candida]|nr:unnamed protein product [Albugo candida]|eukprot:CCI50019.1 unnamed protein product [Albugo candida]